MISIFFIFSFLLPRFASALTESLAPSQKILTTRNQQLRREMSEDQYQPYSYRPLDRSRKEIRLIFVVNQDEIQFLAETINADPEVSSDLASVRSLEDTYPVCCTIQHVSLEDKPAYAALSYTWGDANRMRRLVVEEDGRSFELRVTENLDSALRHIAINGEFWIDAVCINQDEELEKSWQVQQMWTIYNSAEYTAT